MTNDHPRRDPLPIASLNIDCADAQALAAELFLLRHRIAFSAGCTLTTGAENVRLAAELDSSGHLIALLVGFALPLRCSIGVPRVSWSTTHDPSGTGRDMNGGAS